LRNFDPDVVLDLNQIVQTIIAYSGESDH
jgi:hypothetical protein